MHFFLNIGNTHTQILTIDDDGGRSIHSVPTAKFDPASLPRDAKIAAACVVAEKMGKAYHQYLLQHPDGEIDDFKHIIILFDDILIHGRALGGLLSEAEDIFADTFLSVSKNSCRRREELYDVFLKRIVIRTAFRNSNPNLLRLRYKSRIIPEDNLYEPSEWRWFGYEIAESVYQAEVPNAAFVPAVLLDGRYMRGRIKKTSIEV